MNDPPRSTDRTSRPDRVRLLGVAVLIVAAVGLLWWYRTPTEPEAGQPAQAVGDSDSTVRRKGFPRPPRGTAVPSASGWAVTAATFVGLREPLATLAVFYNTLSNKPGGRPSGGGSVVERVPPAEAELVAGVDDRAPVRGAAENAYEARAYNYLLTEARRHSAESFAASARHDLTYAHLFEQPADYRGQVVHVAGRLRRLRKFDPPRAVAAEGVPALYEAWVFDANYGSNPYCIVTSELPPGLEPGEKLDRQVAFDGYFFKRYRYDAGDGKRDAPLFLGHTLRLNEAPVVPASPFSFGNAFLPTFLGFLLTIGLAALAVSLWFRRGDRQVRGRVAAVLRPTFPDDEPGDNLERVAPAGAVERIDFSTETRRDVQ
jgi:hypothetical protein